MRYVKFLTAALIGAVFLSGCAGVSATRQVVADRVVDGVDRYCSTFTETERQLFRDRVNARLGSEGHSLQVNCAADQ